MLDCYFTSLSYFTTDNGNRKQKKRQWLSFFIEKSLLGLIRAYFYRILPLYVRQNRRGDASNQFEEEEITYAAVIAITMLNTTMNWKVRLSRY